MLLYLHFTNMTLLFVIWDIDWFDYDDVWCLTREKTQNRWYREINLMLIHLLIWCCEHLWYLVSSVMDNSWKKIWFCPRESWCVNLSGVMPLACLALLFQNHGLGFLWFPSWIKPKFNAKLTVLSVDLS